MKELEISIGVHARFNGTTFEISENDAGAYEEGLRPQIIIDPKEASRLSAFFLACDVEPDIEWLREMMEEQSKPHLRLVD